MQLLNHAAIPVVAELVMQAADDMHLRTTVVDRFLAAMKNLFVAHCVPFWIPEVRTEGTKATAINANVCWV